MIHSRKTLVKSIFSGNDSLVYRINDSELESLPLRLPAWLKKKALDSFHFLYSGGDRQSYPPPNNYLFLLGFSDNPVVAHQNFSGLDNYCQNDFSFGVISYDLKNDFEKLESNNPSSFEFPKIDFKKHEVVITCSFDGRIEVQRNSQGIDIRNFIEDVLDEAALSSSSAYKKDLTFYKDVSDASYLEKVDAIRDEIKKGNVYELNYCRNFQAQCQIDPFLFFQESMVHNPLSVFMLY